MTENIRVIQYGLGAMGVGITKLLLEREGVEIVGAIDDYYGFDGCDLGTIAGLPDKLGVIVSNDTDKVLRNVEADIMLLSTHSFVDDVFPQIISAVNHNLNVITTAEEMLYPQARFPEKAKKIDELAKKNGVSVLGTGINPGFVLDTLIIALTAPCLTVNSIYASRINDLSPFGSIVMRWQGVGISKEDFQQGVNNGTIVGHVGFDESIHMIASCLGKRIEKIVYEKEPIISTVYRETPFIKVEPGKTAGSKQTAYGYSNGKLFITLVHPQAVRPELEGMNVKDSIIIDGDPKINIEIKPEIAGGKGTIAMVVNMIPSALKSNSGLITMKDLPIPHVWE